MQNLSHSVLYFCVAELNCGVGGHREADAKGTHDAEMRTEVVLSCWIALTTCTVQEQRQK